jgi:hypothetical protein
MPAYLVRAIKDHDLVGVFVAPSVLQLALLIDEVTDPEICEYQRLGSRGIIWTGPATSVPIKTSEDDDEITEEGIPWAEACFTEMWGSAVYDFGAKAKWRRSILVLKMLSIMILSRQSHLRHQRNL